LGPQGLRKRAEGVTLFPELAKLGTHLVEGAVLVAGAMPSSCRQQTKINECCATRSKHGNDKIKEKDKNASPGKRATLDRRGVAAPRSTLG
jgi:hypothetical protein